MASIKFPRQTFEKEIGKLTEDMQQKIALFGTTVENLSKDEIELDITPDRPDLLTYYGFKRSFLAYLGKKTGLKKYTIHEPKENYEIQIEASVKDVRPYTKCAIIKGLKLSDEKIKDLIDLQEKLHSTIGRRRKKLAIGIYPLEKISLPIRYKAVEGDKIKFQPLESPREMTGFEILERHPTGKEYAHLLAGKIKFPIFIDAKDNILSMPPIINSELTGRVTEDTRDIFIECSGFEEDLLNKCLNILVSAFNDMGGKIYAMRLNNSVSPTFKNEITSLSIENTNKLLGLNLTEKEIRQFLERMGHEYEKGKVTSPAYRVDLLHEVDLIEDIAIAYGYDNFEPIIPKISTIGKENSQEVLKRKISEVLTGLGFLEVSNYHLTKESDQYKKMGVPEKQIKDIIPLEDSKTEYSCLRKDLVHYLLKNISQNSDSEFPQKIYELGRVFKLNTKDEIVEEDLLAVAITPGNFTDIKQALNYLSKMLNIGIDSTQELGLNHFIDGRCAQIKINDNAVGSIGEVHPKILKNFKIKMPVSIFELNLKEIFSSLN